MVNYSSDTLDFVFSALSDPTRRAILQHLAQKDAYVTELAEPFDISLPAISKHLRILETAGLLQRRKEGRSHRIRLNVEPFNEAIAWLEYYRKFWESRLDSLEQFLKKSQR